TALGVAGLVAVAAHAADDEGVAAGLEVMLGGDVLQGRLDRLRLEFDHLVAALADQVFVLRVAVVVLVDSPLANFNSPQQPGVDQLRESAIDRWPADAQAGGLDIADQLVGIEMLVLGEDVLDQFALLLREALGRGARGEVLAELALGGLRDWNGR